MSRLHRQKLLQNARADRGDAANEDVIAAKPARAKKSAKKTGARAKRSSAVSVR